MNIKRIKQKLIVFSKTNDLSPKLYTVSVVFYIFSLFAMILIEYRSSFDLSKLVMTIVFGLFVIGNILSFFKKDKDDKSRITNIGLAILLSIHTLIKYYF